MISNRNKSHIKEEGLNLLIMLLMDKLKNHDEDYHRDFSEIKEMELIKHHTFNTKTSPLLKLSKEQIIEKLNKENLTFNKKFMGSKSVYVKCFFDNNKQYVFNLKYVSDKFLKTVPLRQREERYVGNYFIQSYGY